MLRRVGPRGGVTVTCPRREYCWDCHTELSLDAVGNAVAQPMVPRAPGREEVIDYAARPVDQGFPA